MPGQRRGRRGLSESGRGTNTNTAAASRSGDSRLTSTSQATQSTSSASRVQSSRGNEEASTPIASRHTPHSLHTPTIAASASASAAATEVSNSNMVSSAGRGRPARRRGARVHYTTLSSSSSTPSSHNNNSSSSSHTSGGSSNNNSNNRSSSTHTAASSPPSTQALTALPSAVAATTRLPRLPYTPYTNERTALLLPPPPSSSSAAVATALVARTTGNTAGPATESVAAERWTETTCGAHGLTVCKAVRLQSYLTLLLSFCFHSFHILLLLSLLFSGTALRSLFFSPTSMSKTLLRQAQAAQVGSTVGPDKLIRGNNNNQKGANTLPWVESVWSIHDARFFLEPGRTLVPVHIGDSFAARRGHRSGASKADAKIAARDNATHTFATAKKKAATTVAAAHSTRQDALNALDTSPPADTLLHSTPTRDLHSVDKSTQDTTHVYTSPEDKQQQEHIDNNNNSVVQVAVMAAKAEANDKTGTSKAHSNTPHATKAIRLSALAAAWEASPLYASPLALCLYYYLYLMGCLIMLYVLHTPQLTGHYAVLRLIIALLEALWYVQHGSHALLTYVWLLFLSHWPAKDAASNTSGDVVLERRFLRRGTPYAVIEHDGPGHIRWYYYDKSVKSAGRHPASPTLHDESMDLTHYLYRHTSALVFMTHIVTACLLALLIVCVLRDGRRCGEALAGLRPLRQPEHCLLCPLCNEVMVEEEQEKQEEEDKGEKYTRYSVRRGWRWLWLRVRHVWPHHLFAALLCGAQSRTPAQPWYVHAGRSSVVLRDAFYGVMRLPAALLPSPATIATHEGEQEVVKGTVLQPVRRAAAEDEGEDEEDDVVVMEVQYDEEDLSALHHHPPHQTSEPHTHSAQHTPRSAIRTLPLPQAQTHTTIAGAGRALTPYSTPASAVLSAEDHRQDLERLTHRMHHRCPKLYLDKSAESTSNDDDGDGDDDDDDDDTLQESGEDTATTPSHQSHSSGTSLTTSQPIPSASAPLTPPRVPRGRSFSPRRQIPPSPLSNSNQHDAVTSSGNTAGEPHGVQAGTSEGQESGSVLQRTVRTVPGVSPTLPLSRRAARLTNASAAFMSFAYPANYGTMTTMNNNNAAAEAADNEEEEEEGEDHEGHGALRAAYEPLKDTEDEFRPGNAFLSYDAVSLVSKMTGSWLDACMQYTLLEPALFRHERFLPALPPSLASLEATLLAAWRLWVNRKVWYAEARRAPSARLLPSQATLQLVAEDTLEETMVQLGSMEVANAEANRSDDDDEDDEEDEPSHHSGNEEQLARIVSPTGPQGLSNARLRPQRPRRALREQVFLWLTRPLRAALAQLFFYVYIARSQTVRHTYEHMLRGLLRRRHNAAASYNNNTHNSYSDDDDDSDRESVLPTHMYDHLARSDVSLFRLFLEHRSGRVLMYCAGPCLLLRELLLVATVPALAHLLFVLVGLACVDLQHTIPGGEITNNYTSVLCRAYAGQDGDTEQLLFASALRWGGVLAALLTCATFAAQAFGNELCLATLEARNALCSLLLEKVMVLPLAQQQGFSHDEVTRLVERDVGHACAALQVLHRGWSYPLRFVLITALVAYYLHWLPALLVLLAAACVVLPLGRVAAAQVRLALRRGAVAQQGRLAFLTRVLTHMREVKAGVLEQLCAELASLPYGDTSKEGSSGNSSADKAAGQLRWAQACLALCTEGGLLLLLLLCFAVYYYYVSSAADIPFFASSATHNTKDTTNTAAAAATMMMWRMDRIVPCLAALDLLLIPLTSFASMCGCLVRGYLAMKRMEAYLRHTPDVFTGTWMDVTQLTASSTSGDNSKTQQKADASLGARHVLPERGTVRCIGGCFTWQSDPGNVNDEGGEDVTLREVDMTILPGELAVVQGSVGTGKTMLLLAMLGEVNRCIAGPSLLIQLGPDAPPLITAAETNEGRAERHEAVAAPRSITVAGRPIAPLTTSMSTLMHLTPLTPPLPLSSSSTVRGGGDADKATLEMTRAQDSARHTNGFEVYGSCAYCAQQPWLQADTIRANILAGGNAAETKWYRQVLQACALTEDLAALPKGELSVVGEAGGARLSQSLRVRIALARAVFARADIYFLDGILTPLTSELRRRIVRDVLHGLLRHRTVILCSNVGLSELQPHRIFTVTARGRVREDTELYTAIRSTRRGARAATAHLPDSDSTADKAKPANAQRAHASRTSNNTAARDTAAPLPPLFAEEYEESIAAADEVYSAASSASSNAAGDGDNNSEGEEGTVLANTQAAVEAEVCVGTAGNEVALELTEHTTGGGSLLAQEKDVRHVDLVRRTRKATANARTASSSTSSSSSSTAAGAAHTHGTSVTTTRTRRADAEYNEESNEEDEEEMGYDLALLARHSSSESSSSSTTTNGDSDLDTRDAERRRTQAKAAAVQVMPSILIPVPAPASATEGGDGRRAQVEGQVPASHAGRPHSPAHVRVTTDWRSLRLFYGRYMHGRLYTAGTVLTALLYGGCVLLVWLHLAGWSAWHKALRANEDTKGSAHQAVGVPSLSVLVLLVVLGELCLVLQTHFFHAALTQAMRAAEQEAWAHVLRAPLTFFDSPHPQLLRDIVVEDSRRAHHTLPATFAMLFSAALQLGLTVTVIALVHPSFVLLLPFAGLMSGRVTRRLMDLTRQLHRLQRRALRDTVSVLRECVRGAATVRCLSLQDRTRESYAQSLHTSTAAEFTSTMALGWARVRLSLVAVVLVMAVIGMWAWSRHSSPAIEALALLLALRLLLCLPLLCETFSQLHHLWAPQRRVLELLSLPAEPMYGARHHAKDEVSNVHPAEEEDEEEEEDAPVVLQLDRVSAQHRLAAQYGLRGFSLDVRAGGERVGLVGRPGSGRSMLPEVLLRLAMVTHEAGTVWLYSQNNDTRREARVAAHTVPYPLLRHLFLYVSLDPQLRLVSWRDHLHIDSFLLELSEAMSHDTTLAAQSAGQPLSSPLWSAHSPNTSATGKGLQPFLAAWQALHTVGLDKIAQADGGLDAPIRHSLSVVQRQLLCLARAFVYQPPFILYEEAEAEAETHTLHEALRRASTLWGCTVLLLPCRRSTVASLCTRVVLVDSGAAAPLHVGQEGDTHVEGAANAAVAAPVRGYAVNEAVLAALEPYMSSVTS